MSDESKDRIIAMHNDIYLLKQVRKALNDIQESFRTNHADKAEYEVWLLWIMINEQPSRRKPWSHYQPRVAEEFDE